MHIAKKLNEKLNDCELVPIAGFIKQESIIATSEKVGFVFPVYSWSLPKIVCDFVEKIDLINTKYLFAITTMGGFSEQYVAPKLNELLKPKNKELDLSSNLRVFSNNIWGSKRINPVPNREKGEKRIKKAEIKLEGLAELIRSNQKGKAKKKSKFPMKGSYNKFLNEVNTMDEKYYANEKCNGCGTCEKICPVDNIKLVNEKPEWQHKCQMCTACLHYCPQIAIEWGEFSVGRERYQNYYVKLKEIMDQKSVE